MSQVINIAAGISTIGNPTKDTVNIADINVNAVNSYKTILDGIWKSFTKGAPDAFQGFTVLESGKGYVVNSDSVANFTLPGDNLDINDMVFTPGLAMLSFPFSGRSLGTGYIPRIKLASLKTIDSTWKTWTAGAPDAYQGVLTLDIAKGYVVNIESVYDEKYLDTATITGAQGVRFNQSDSTITHGVTVGGVTYTDPNSAGIIRFDAADTYDNTVPTLIMFFELEGRIAKVEYPAELDGKPFYITTTTNSTEYRGVFGENEDYSAPTVIDTVVDESGIGLSFTEKNTTATDYKEMNVICDGTNVVFEYVADYEGDTLRIYKDGKSATTIFSEGTTTVTLA